MVNHILRDLRYAVRWTMRRPAFAVAILLILAIGLGASIAMFTIVDTVVLRPLPYPAGDRLTIIKSSTPTGQLSLPDFEDLRSGLKNLTGVVAVSRSWSRNLVWNGEADRVNAARVSGDFFSTMAMPAHLGRALVPEEDRVGGPPVVVLSYALWQSRFGADPAVVGKRLRLNGVDHTIVGVMPRDFTYPTGHHIWLPLALDPSQWGREALNLEVIGRLNSSASLEAVRAELAVVGTRLGQQPRPTQFTVSAIPLSDHIVGDTRVQLFILFGAVVVLLLIATSNSAALLLARGVSRVQELAVRQAHGASRGRLISQLLVEATLLSLVAAVAGLGLATVILRALQQSLNLQETLPRLEFIQIDARAAAFTVVIALVTGVVTGLIPALWSMAHSPADRLRDAGRSVVGSAAGRWLRGLVVVEVALCAVLMVGAGLLIASFWHLSRVDPGFDKDNVLTFRMALPGARYQGPVRQREFFQRAIERVQQIPGVQAVGVVGWMPFTLPQPSLNFAPAGAPPTAPGHETSAGYQIASRGYFAALGVDLKRGRLFEASDNAAAPPVAVVNEAFVRAHLRNKDPLLERIEISDGAGIRQIVGVVEDIRRGNLEIPSEPEVYVHFQQRSFDSMSFAVRTSGNPAPQTAAVRAAIRELDPFLPLYNVGTLAEFVDKASWQRRLNTALLTGFAVVAALLMVFGLYSLMSFLVSLRSDEVALRMAMGANRANVAWLIMGDGIRLTLAGVAIGLVVTVGLVRGRDAMMFNVAPTDPSIFAAGALLLVTAALAATAIPVLRVGRVDPAGLLRRN